MKKTYFAPETEVVILQSQLTLMAGSLTLTDTDGLADFGDGGDVIGEDLDIGEADSRDFFGDEEDYSY